jgi:hypothetical protein
MLCHSQNIGNDENPLVKLTADRPFADPDKAARRLLEHAPEANLETKKKDVVW